MANLDSLNFLSISETSREEALQRIASIRFSRRTVVREPKPQSLGTKTKAAAKQSKSKLSADDAAELLKLLMGGS
jgi:hypothetical protein